MIKRLHEQFLEELSIKNEGYRNKEFEILSEYECSQCLLYVKTKFGLCLSLPNNLLKNKRPTIKSAIDKTEYFINKAKEIHGDRYNYDLVEYISARRKVKIMSKFGIFEQSPNAHLQGRGSRLKYKELQRESPPAWNYSTWQTSAEVSKKFGGMHECFSKLIIN